MLKLAGKLRRVPPRARARTRSAHRDGEPDTHRADPRQPHHERRGRDHGRRHRHGRRPAETRRHADRSRGGRYRRRDPRTTSSTRSSSRSTRPRASTAPAWDCPWSARSSRATAASSRSRPRPAARRSRSICRVSWPASARSRPRPPSCRAARDSPIPTAQPGACPLRERCKATTGSAPRWPSGRSFFRSPRPPTSPLSLARRGAPFVDRVSEARPPRSPRVGTPGDPGLVVLRQQPRRSLAPDSLEPDDQPLDDLVVDAPAADPAMAVLVVVDHAFTDVILVIDRHDVVDAHLGHGALVELVARAERLGRTRGSALRAFAAMLTAVTPPSTVRTTSRIQITR